MHPFEDKLERKLISVLGADGGSSYMDRYTSARDKSFDDIISQIAASEPNLTKHDTSHIKNVMTRVHQLLGEENDDLTAFEIYTLAIIVLFHDVGNIFGRKNHQTNAKVAKVYNYVRGEEPRWKQERLVVLKAVEAHTGRSDNGEAKDTLKDVDAISNLEDGQKIRLRDLAAVLRFADELEEGPGRTSLFKQKIAGEQGGYETNSLLYHEYSNVTNVFIDRGNGRIVLRYHINWDSKKDPDGKVIMELLRFCFARILKLDDERKYTKYYCELLSPFKKTEVSFHFTIDQIPFEIGLNSLEFHDDIPIPRVNFEDDFELTTIGKKNPEYNAQSIFERIKQGLTSN